MYRLLVVDDEAFITDGLARMLQGVKERELDVYKAYSALQAMEFLDRTSVDIVVTDIQMPGMSGLELLEEINRRWPSCYVIFLTGHDAFEYAYKAVQYHAVRYILKNEGDEVLLAAIMDCIADIDRKEKNDELLAEAGEQMRLCLPLMRREFLQSILKGKALEHDRLAAEFRRLDIGLDGSLPALLLAARLDNYAAEDLSTPIDIVIREKLKHAASCEIGFQDPGFMLWLIQPLDGESYERAAVTVKGVVESVQRTCVQSLNASLSFVFDKWPAAWGELNERCINLKYLVEYRLDRHAEMMFADCEFFWGEDVSGSLDVTALIKLRDKLPELAHSLDRGDKDDFNKRIGEFKEALRPHSQQPSFNGMELQHSLYLVLLSFITKHGLENRIIADADMKDFFIGQDIGFKQGSIEKLALIGNRLIEYLAMEQRDKGDAFVDQINRYIYENLSTVSLVSLSEQVYLNPSYLSRRYKEITGKNISNTISEARLNRAIRLLADPQYKIGEISAMVGYESPAHFSRVFKRQMGIGPQEYRDRTNNRL